MHRWTESHPPGCLIHFCGAFLLGFLWPVILICLVLSPYLVYLRILPWVPGCASQGLWVDFAWYRFWPPRNFLVGKVSWTQEWKICGLLCDQGPTSFLDCHATDTLEFVHRWTPVAYSGVGGGGHLPPASKNRNLSFQPVQWGDGVGGASPSLFRQQGSQGRGGKLKGPCSHIGDALSSHQS